AEVAPVGDRDPQVVEGPAQPVERRHGTAIVAPFAQMAPGCCHGATRMTPSRCDASPRHVLRAARTGPTVRPALTAGTTSGLHRTDPCDHDASTRKPRPSADNEDPSAWPRPTRRPDSGS